MASIKEECSMFPETLLDATSDLAIVVPPPEEAATWDPLEPPPVVRRRWWTIYTKSRQEKSLARDMQRLQIPFYLPLIDKPSAYQGRKRIVRAPLFGGYIFMFASAHERIQTLTTNRISRILTVENADQLLFDLQQLRQLIAAGAPLTIESRLAAGRRVRVRQGPFAGLEGIVLKRRNATRLLVSINFLQQGASVEIDDFMLDPLD
jgi:transcriptional antiterminator RfaH